MNKDIEFKKEIRIKGGDKILNLIKSFGATEKVIFAILCIVLIFSSLSLAHKASLLFMVETPTHGGSFNEGIIGLPRSINPVLAFTDVDRDLSTLIYSGLMKFENGQMINDIAEKYTISEDGLIYHFTIKENVRFHDGIELTTDDIEFTIQKIQDAGIKSPKRPDWAGVTVKKINSREIQFILKKPYSPFLSNTSIGIIPKHIWKNFDSDQFVFSKFNLEPIGTGPYRIKNIEKDKSGVPIRYNLVAFKKYYTGEPYITNLSIDFYANEKLALESYNSKKITNFAGISPKEISQIASSTDSIKILHTPLPRIFGVFFNQNSSPVLANKNVRKALNLAINREEIIEKVLFGYGTAIDSPLPAIKNSNNNVIKQDIEAAKEILRKDGWVINKDGILEKKSDKKSGGQTQVLSFSISTSDATDLKQVAEMISKTWSELGVQVDVKVFEYGDLAQNIIKTRKYDALLFGEVIGKDLDLYAFWHSSQKNYPGLNVPMYVNSKVDSILEEARTVSDETKKNKLYKNFEEIIKDEVPSVFIYSPEYMYITSNKIKGNSIDNITNTSDRFYGIEKWYIETDNVWKIFKKNN